MCDAYCIYWSRRSAIAPGHAANRSVKLKELFLLESDRTVGRLTFVGLGYPAQQLIYHRITQGHHRNHLIFQLTLNRIGMDTFTAYNIDKFNTLPDVVESDISLRSNEDLPQFWGAIRALFLNYISMAEIVGVVLLHKHFELGKKEALVDVNNSSTPWRLPIHKKPRSGVFKKHHGFIRPQSWLLEEGKLMPYEFYFDPGQKDAAPALDAKFVQDFAELLTSFNLVSVLGLYLRQGENPRQSKMVLTEVTEGRANVKYPALDDSRQSHEYIQTSWCYDPELVESGLGSFITITECKTGRCQSQGQDSHTKAHYEVPSDSDDAIVAFDKSVEDQEAQDD
jgi:hypothetical protein